MHRLCACLILLVSSCLAADNSAAAILNRTVAAVAAQLAHQANYTCVQTIEREYLVTQKHLPHGCGNDTTAKKKLSMRDRLRLDVAVSEGREIYSWHGEAKFTSSRVSDVVQTGPISSGSFVGFLQNIFLRPGARFTLTSELQQNGSTTYSFNYAVPLAHSVYRVQGGKRAVPVPFHGSFSVRSPDYELAELHVIADAIPEESDICSAQTDVTYQMVNISGHPSLIPATFLLHLDDDSHWHTVSRNEYSDCREFRGESTMHFEFTDDAAQASPKQRSADRWLPAGIPLNVQIQTRIDDRTSYVGDSVEGVLLNRFKVPGTKITVPKGAVLTGVITSLETHYLPEDYQLFSVKFTRLSYSGGSLLLSAHLKTSSGDTRTLGSIYGLPLPSLIEKDAQAGVIVTVGSHLQLGRYFSAQWMTASPSAADASSSPDQ